MPEENQSQDETTQVAETVGAETPQLDEPTGEEKLGTEETPQEPQEEVKPRTFTQEEWSKRESEKDKETNLLREQLARISMQGEIDKAQQAEAVAKSKDQREVEEGAMTTSEASQREQTRVQQTQTATVVAQQKQAMSQMAQQTEQYGRVLASQDFGKEYELTSEQITELLSDKDVKTPGDMKAKAADLALERERGKAKKATEEPPKFDQGVSGATEASLAGKSPQELAQIAYGPEETKRRKNKRR